MKIKNLFKKKSNERETYFVADIAANHDGDLSKAKELIYAAAESGANSAKFQNFKAETIVSDLGFKYLGKKYSHQSKWKNTVFETYKSEIHFANNIQITTNGRNNEELSKDENNDKFFFIIVENKLNDYFK